QHAFGVERSANAFVKRCEGRRLTLQRTVAWRVRDACARADDRARLELRELHRQDARREADDAERSRLPLANLRPDVRPRLLAAYELPRAGELRRHRGLAALEEHGDAARVEHVERARYELGAPDRGHDAGGLRRLDHERPRRFRHPMQPQRHAGDEPEPPARAADELAEVVAGDVLDHLAAGVGDRAVREDDGYPEHEIAWRAEAVAERTREAGGEAGAERRVARRVEREPLPRAPE